MPKYQLSVYAERLPRGSLRTPNPYAKVSVSGGPKEGTEIGRTETITKTANPDWVSIFLFETDSSIFMPLKVEIWDDYGIGQEDVLMCSASFEATEVAQSPGHLRYHDIPGGGKIYLSVEESIRGDSRGYIRLQFRGLDIKNVEPGLLGLGRSDPFVEVRKKNADHSVGQVRWNVVYRSDHISNHLNPFWQEFSIGLEELCYCDLKWPLQIIVMDWQPNGKHRKIGQFEATVELLMERVAVKGNADRETAFEIYSERNDKLKVSGLIVVLKAELVPDK